ncbi:carbon storage regulator [Aquisphaera insulae]|uniref:carbon storage regulator n=1 Tax=Aquisphaera insulae TaxID=2712864 RepID=UPI0013EC1725|nr:carbon storage regulator [Aquisphaera insulae]
MLVLTRKVGEKIVIAVGGDVVVTLLMTEKRQARLGIEAPRDVTILRGELTEAFGRPEVLPPAVDPSQGVEAHSELGADAKSAGAAAGRSRIGTCARRSGGRR